MIYNKIFQDINIIIKIINMNQIYKIKFKLIFEIVILIIVKDVKL